MVGFFLTDESEVSSRGECELLFRIIRECAALGESCEIHFERPSGEHGVVGIEGEQIVHARSERAAGVPAFLQIAQWRDARLVEQTERGEERTILMDPNDLLAEFRKRVSRSVRSVTSMVESTLAYDGSYETQEKSAPPCALGDEPTAPDPVTDAEEGEDFDFFQAALRASRTDVVPLKRSSDPLSHFLLELRGVDGFVAGAVIDAQRGVARAVERTEEGFDVSAAAKANAVLMRAGAFGTMGAVEDVVVTLGDQYHLMRPLSFESDLFFYLAMHREGSNLALARLMLERLSGEIAA